MKQRGLKGRRLNGCGKVDAASVEDLHRWLAEILDPGCPLLKKPREFSRP
jgi:hypothetical protein